MIDVIITIVCYTTTFFCGFYLGYDKATKKQKELQKMRDENYERAMDLVDRQTKVIETDILGRIFCKTNNNNNNEMSN